MFAKTFSEHPDLFCEILSGAGFDVGNIWWIVDNVLSLWSENKE